MHGKRSALGFIGGVGGGGGGGVTVHEISISHSQLNYVREHYVNEVRGQLPDINEASS